MWEPGENAARHSGAFQAGVGVSGSQDRAQTAREDNPVIGCKLQCVSVQLRKLKELEWVC